MLKAEKLIKNQPVSVKFNLLELLDEDVKETVIAPIWFFESNSQISLLDSAKLTILMVFSSIMTMFLTIFALLLLIF